MKVVIQRVLNASVVVDQNIVGKINNGFLVLLGIANDDTEEKVTKMVKKIVNLRIFNDENDKMNLNIKQVNGEILVVSQFTLYADCSGGNRPSFALAGNPELANKLYEFFVSECKKEGIKTEHGIFGAHMKVDLINNGPVTILLES